MKKELLAQCKALKTAMAKQRSQPKATYKELATLIEAHKTGDYTAMFNTKLYINHGGEYCEYLSLLA